jgi:hypothetical protein
MINLLLSISLELKSPPMRGPILLIDAAHGFKTTRPDP